MMTLPDLSTEHIEELKELILALIAIVAAAASLIRTRLTQKKLDVAEKKLSASRVEIGTETSNTNDGQALSMSGRRAGSAAQRGL